MEALSQITRMFDNKIYLYDTPPPFFDTHAYLAFLGKPSLPF